MIRGLYIPPTGMITQQNRMDVVTNNLANASTTAYKEDTLLSRSFQDLLISRLEDPAVVGLARDVGPLNNGIHVDQLVTSFTGGALRETSQNTDLALLGDGFFVVQTPEGERYTRSGQFSLSADGYLTTAEGYLVQGRNGPIQVGNASFSVDGSGLVRTAAGQDQLRLVSFTDQQGLRKEGSNLYSNYNTQMAENTAAQVRQGFLESSNVDLSSQMVNMIDIQRNYELNQRVVKMMDERLGRAVNDIGRL